MAASYAALVSLIHVLNRAQHPTCPAPFEKQQIQSLLAKVNSLVNFLEGYSQQISQDLVRKMVDAAFAAEDTIESYIANHILRSSSSPSHFVEVKTWVRSFIPKRPSDDPYGLICQDLEKFIQETDLIIKQTMEVERNNAEKDQTSIRSYARSETVKMVGFEDEFTRLMGQLTARQPSRQIIPIVGMGGIGKTTLATNVYNNRSFKHHFDIKAWVTISQVYSAGQIIRTLLRDLGVSNADHISDIDVGVQLHKSLIGRKYLLILDDIWDTKAWDEISRFCPDNNNGSRILLTTRILEVALTVGSCSPFDISLLDADKSWVLLSTTVFGGEACPPELEECGKKISKSCKGLPLAISLIGGLLTTLERTRKHWEDVAENIRSRDEGDHCLNILSLSYHQLPIHLKPCFLYFATYPYDFEIHVSELIQLWSADGLLRPNASFDTLEEVALNSMKDLISRNLIMVKKKNPCGEVKRLIVHDLVMDLCMREVQRQGFLYVDSRNGKLPETEQSQRRLVFSGSDKMDVQPNKSSRSIILFNKLDSPRRVSRSILLRVCVLPGRCKLKDLEQLVNLRLLNIGDDNFKVPLNTSLLWNLETLTVGLFFRNFKIPTEIWNLRHIKHLIFLGDIILPDPPPTSSDADFVLQNLQTLGTVYIRNDKVFNMIPSIKKLSISSTYSYRCGFDNLARCEKLETAEIRTECIKYPISIKFPNSLRKLTLGYCNVSWENSGLGLLPNLQVFKLRAASFNDNKWNTVDGEFQSLIFLSINSCDLESWIMEDSCHFPCLQNLHLTRMPKLVEIPEVLGESNSLESIKLINCLLSTFRSAKQILDEQQCQGNSNLTVDVEVQYGTVAAAELESMANDNFHVEYYHW